MGKTITRVRWSAQNVPWGMSFDEKTGTFSGTPEEAGEYTVPVSVETNYGKDTKDIKVVVDDERGYVYATGAQAKTWSSNAEQDEYGFRRLNMPKASKLARVVDGFCAKTGAMSWYVCGVDGESFGNFSGVTDKLGGFEASTPAYLPVSGITSMNGTAYSVVYILSDGRGFARDTAKSLDYSIPPSSFPLFSPASVDKVSLRNAVKTSKILSIPYPAAARICVISDADCLITSSDDSVSLDAVMLPVEISRIKKVAVSKSYVASGGSYRSFYFLDVDGELWHCEYTSSSKDPVITRQAEGLGKIKNFWNSGAVLRFVQNGNNELYAKGTNTTYGLGLPDAVTYNDHAYVGTFDIKEMDGTGTHAWLLTKDGKLYHTGTAGYISGVAGQDKGFTETYPGFRFIEMKVIGGGFGSGAKATLVVTREV